VSLTFFFFNEAAIKINMELCNYILTVSVNIKIILTLTVCDGR